MSAVRKARAYLRGDAKQCPQAVVAGLIEHIEASTPRCTHCVGAGGWEVHVTESAHCWRECHHCHGTGLAPAIAA